MLISIVNFTAIPDAEVQGVVRAINRQIAEDFEPYWSMGARLRLEGKAGRTPQKQFPQELRGDAILYLWDQVDLDGALGYHDQNNVGLPFGFVFTHLAKQLGEPWSVTLSHEALEMIGDANVNLLAAGPHPANPKKTVFHWYEMCDAVQAETYDIDGVAVSNFVLPLYFTLDEQPGSRNDFLGTVSKGKRLISFGVNPGGYVGFFNPASGQHETYSHKGDQKAKKRMEVKAKAQLTRRSLRYGGLDERVQTSERCLRVKKRARK
jgi:hypothetical protein